MKLGELLIQDGVISIAQLRSALEAQRTQGGRIGTILFEQGALDVDTLARALARQQKVLPALEQQMANITPAIVGMVPAKLAEKHRAMPIHFDAKPAKKLYVAFVDPHQLSAIDELGFQTGSRIVPMVAPELSIAYLLEKHYGILRDRRLMRVHPMGSTLDAGIPLDDDFDELSEPGPGHDPRFSPPPERPLEAPIRPAPAARPSPAPAAVPVPVIGPVNDTPGFFAPAAARANEFSMPEAEQTDPMFFSPALTGIRNTGLSGPGMTLEEAKKAIASAKSRDEVGQACIEFLRPQLSCGLVLFCKDGLGLGWKGFSPGADNDAIESISLPLQGAASVFSLVFESQSPYVGPPPPQGVTLQTRLWKLLRCPSPQHVMTVPVLIKDRVVALVYGHNQENAIAPQLVTDLVQLCEAVADGFTRIIQESKRKRTGQQS